MPDALSGTTSASSYSNSSQGSYPSLTTRTSPITSTSSLASARSLHQSYRVLLAVSLEDEPTPLNAESWARWLASNAPLHVREMHSHIRLEEVFQSNQTMVLIPIPISVWSRLLNTPAYRFIDFVMGDSLLIARGADANAQNDRYGNALCGASLQGHRETVRMLLDARANVNAQSKLYAPILRGPSSFGDEEMVRMLLDAGADINEGAVTSRTALQEAASLGHENVVRLLIARGADLDERGTWYGTALQEARRRGHSQMAQVLLEMEPDLISFKVMVEYKTALIVEHQMLL